MCEMSGCEGRRIGAFWEYATEHGFVIVSKDTDFYQRSLVHGSPPKVVWLRVGNVPTAVVVGLLRSRHEAIRVFLDDPNATFMPFDASD